MSDWTYSTKDRPWTVDGRCHADRDGDCHWDECPQLRDKEPSASGRSCPIWIAQPEDDS